MPLVVTMRQAAALLRSKLGLLPGAWFPAGDARSVQHAVARDASTPAASHRSATHRSPSAAANLALAWRSRLLLRFMLRSRPARVADARPSGCVRTPHQATQATQRGSGPGPPSSLPARRSAKERVGSRWPVPAAREWGRDRRGRGRGVIATQSRSRSGRPCAGPDATDGSSAQACVRRRRLIRHTPLHCVLLGLTSCTIPFHLCTGV